MEQNVTPVSSIQLVQAIEQLSPQELDHLADEVAALRARRNAPLLSEDESALFAVINQSLSADERMRLAELGEKRADEALTLEEHQEMLTLQQKLEALHAERMRSLAQLAKLRGVTLTALMAQLGIQFPDYE